MPNNPERSSRGGDVSGETPIDVTQGEAIKVATASYEPGYPLDGTLKDVNKADLVTGYCGYGKAIGEGSKGEY